MSSDQNILALADGSTARARAMVRVVPSARWDSSRVLKLAATPLNEKADALDNIESEENQHEHPQV